MILFKNNKMTSKKVTTVNLLFMQLVLKYLVELQTAATLNGLLFQEVRSRSVLFAHAIWLETSVFKIYGCTTFYISTLVNPCPAEPRYVLFLQTV